MQLNVAVTLFFDRCGAQRGGGKPEFPPSPARLLQAALAGAYQLGSNVEDVRKGIQYLECQKPPEIFAVKPTLDNKIQHYVHNNVVKEYDSEEINTRKALNTTRLAGSDAQVVYSWTLPDDAPAFLSKAFDGLLALGHGDDMAYARVIDAIPPRPLRYIPVRGGVDASLIVPCPGFLADLDVAYRNQDRSEITSRHLQGYALEQHLTQLRQIAKFELEWMDSENLFAIDASKAAIVAAWVRHAALEALKLELPADLLLVVAGHGEPKGPRISYLPLPTAGEYADGMIRRVCISAPPELADAIQLMRNLLPGRVLTDNEGKEVCRLREPRSNAVFDSYTSSGMQFETVTSAVFPHHLTKNGKLNSGRMQELLTWFTEAGLPEPVAISVESAREKFFTNAYLRHLPQYHMRVRFDREIVGPVVVGLGRASGLGIFANLTGFSATRRFATNGGSAKTERATKSVVSEAVTLS
jgi:CRISPR-associated protein Csb2